MNNLYRAYLYSAPALVIGLAVLQGCSALPGAASPNQPSVAQPESSWKLVWSDEFDGSQVDPGKWWLAVDCSGGGNNQAECFTDRPENAHVDGDGILHIVAREEKYSGPALSPLSPDYDPNDRSVTKSYTSASLRSRHLFDFRYGRVEVRAKLPAGQGMWPSIWMLPTNEVYGGWPRSGEIDIMEALNLGTEGAKNQVHGSLNYGLLFPQWSSLSKAFDLSTSLTRKYHTFAVEWEADEIRWFVDDIHYSTQTAQGWYNYLWAGQEKGFEVPNPRAPYDQEFYLIIQSTIGGDWPGPPDTGWEAEREYLVDYVRVYQCDSGNADGTGCANADNARIDPSIAPVADGGAPRVNEFILFGDGPETMALDTPDGTLGNRLRVDRWQASEGNVSLSTVDIGGERGPVLEVTFDGPGNVFLSSGDMSENPGIDDGFSLAGGSGWAQYGTLEFDIFIESIDAGTTLLAKLDSGYPNLGQLAIETPAIGQWTHAVIRVADLIANPLNGGNGLDLYRVVNPFVIEAAGTSRAKIRLDNIALTCVVNEYARVWQSDQSCSLEPVYISSAITGTTEIFTENISDWMPGDCCGGTRIEIVTDDVEPGRGKVIEFSYDTDETVSLLSSKRPLDFSALAGGTLEFDLLVLRGPEKPAAQDPWKMKVSCGYPCDTGDVPLTASLEGQAPEVGVWQHFTFAIDDLVERGLKLEKLDAPLVIFPSWGNQKGAVFRIDNLVVKAAP